MKHAAVAVALIVAAIGFYAPAFSNGHGWAMDDFKTFYCSGRVLLERQDPYRAGPLAACEAQPAPRPIFVAKPGFVLPAPLPGYTIAGFALIARLPFMAALALWLLLLAAATVAAIVVLSRLTGANAWDVAAAFSIALIAISFAVGELVPIALFGVALVAWAVSRERVTPWTPVLAACGVALAFCEPQVGAAVAIACALRSWRFALSAALAVATLCCISVLAIGVPGNVAYVRDVLPAHVSAELPAYFQFSLSWMLDRLGVVPGTALALGRLQWIAMLAVTALFARSRFASRHPEIGVLAAPAFAVAGGPFLHLDHIALALPAAIWLVAKAPRPSWWRTATVVALAVPLLHLLILVRWLPMAAVLAFIVVACGWLGGAFGRSATAGLGSALAASVVVAIVMAALVAGGFGFASAQPAQSVASSMSQAPWAHFVATHYVMTAWPIWLVKAPTWLGLAATAAALIGLATARTPEAPSRRAEFGEGLQLCPVPQSASERRGASHLRSFGRAFGRCSRP